MHDFYFITYSNVEFHQVYFLMEKGRLKSTYIKFKSMANEFRVVFFKVNRLLFGEGSGKFAVWKLLDSVSFL